MQFENFDKIPPISFHAGSKGNLLYLAERRRDSDESLWLLWPSAWLDHDGLCKHKVSPLSPLLESSLESFSLTKQLCDYRGCGHNTTVCHNGYSNTRFTARHTPNDTTKPFSFISTRVGKISFRATQKGLPKFGTNSKSSIQMSGWRVESLENTTHFLKCFRQQFEVDYGHYDLLQRVR